MLTYTIRKPLVKTDNLLGESPLWDQDRQTLFWVDIDRGLLNAFLPATAEFQVYEIGQKLGCIALTQDGHLLLATELGFASYLPGDSAPANFMNVIPPHKGLMFNDGKVSPDGEFWVGSKGPRGEASLYRLSESLDCRILIENISISNGIGWSLDHKFFYHTDSLNRTIYRYSLQGKELANKEVFYTPLLGTPDGLAIDADGNLWVAIWDGWRVVKISPEGKETAQILLPVSRPTSVAFGGKDLSTLFITSASVELSSTELAEQPLAGSLFSITLSVHGQLSNRFMLRA